MFDDHDDEVMLQWSFLMQGILTSRVRMLSVVMVVANGERILERFLVVSSYQMTFDARRGDEAQIVGSAGYLIIALRAEAAIGVAGVAGDGSHLYLCGEETTEAVPKYEFAELSTYQEIAPEC